MISNGEKRKWSENLVTRVMSEQQQWHYLAVKKLSALSTGLTSKCHGDLYFFNYFILLQQKRKLESHKKVSKNKDF